MTRSVLFISKIKSKFRANKIRDTKAVKKQILTLVVGLLSVSPESILTLYCRRNVLLCNDILCDSDNSKNDF
jgi:hypothetical protein